MASDRTVAREAEKLDRSAALRAIINETLALYVDPGAVEMLADYEGAQVVAHGWYSAVRDWTRAALLVGDADLYWSAAPLRRSMLEHALALSWLADKPTEVLASLDKAEQKRVADMREAAEAGHWSIPDELYDEILDPPVDGSSEDRNLHFTNLARERSAANARVAWFSETAVCHPSLSSAQRYLATWPAARGTQLPPEVGAVENKQQVALWLLAATREFHRFLRDQPWVATLADLEKRFTSLFDIRTPPSEPTPLWTH
jgi:hypothetical protein